MLLLIQIQHVGVLCYIIVSTNRHSFVNAAGQQRVFGIPLRESLKYASVQISTANANRELYVWGCIPVVVAKWCVITVFSSVRLVEVDST